MKKTLTYAILVNLFANINTMEKITDSKFKTPGPSFLAMPEEIRLHILEAFIKSVIENNSIFEPFNNIKESIKNIALINQEFYNLKPDLSNFAEKYVKEYFALEYIDLYQEEKDAKLYDIFAHIDVNYSKELEIEAAKLIIAGANLNLLIYNKRFLTNFSLLMTIIRTGKFKRLVKLLIRCKSDINIKNDNNYTALMLAVTMGYIDISQLLINTAADINVQSCNDDTALIIAANYGYIDIVKLLIDAKAALDMKNRGGNTALMIAAELGYEDIAQILIDSGADINIKNNNGYTALMRAISSGHTYIAELLMRASTQKSAQGPSCTIS